MSMFSLLIDAGVPLGPLADPHPMWRAPSARAKLHFDPVCSRPAHHKVHVNLADHGTDDLCAKCARTLPDGLNHYSDIATNLAQWKIQADDVIATGTFGEDWWLKSQNLTVPLLLTGRLFLVEHHLACDIPDLSRWAANELAPVLRTAIATIADGDSAPAFFHPDWAARVTALRSLGRIGATKATLPLKLPAHPALGATLTSGPSYSNTLSDAGAGPILLAAREAFATTWLSTGDLDQAAGAARAAGRDALGRYTPPLLTQLPTGIGLADLPAGLVGDPDLSVADLARAAWRIAAEAEVDTIVETMRTKVAADHTDGVGDRVLVTFSREKISPGAHAGLAAELIRQHTVAVVPGRGGRGVRDEGTIVAVMGEVTYDALTEVLGLSRVNDCHTWGPVADGDTVETFTAAVTLFEQVSVGRRRALDLARATGA